MKINTLEMTYKIKMVEEKNKHPNLLAYVSVSFKTDSGEYFTVSGFTLWKSKFEGYNVEAPSKIGFKYFLSEKSLWDKMKKEIIKQFEFERIPIIEDKSLL
jgi:hypothetical protein